MAYQTVQSKFTASGGGEIHLGITLKPITAWGGISVFAAFCETVELRWALDRVLGGLGENRSCVGAPAPHLATRHRAHLLPDECRERGEIAD
jgi:hypothetical protein